MTCYIKRILTLKEAIRLSNIKIIDLEGVDKTREYSYSWSSDGVCWTNWVSYDMYLQLAYNIESDFYLRILISGSLKGLYIDDVITNCYSISIVPQEWNQNFCEDPNLFQPYANLDCALLLQQQLSDMIVCMFGIPIYYFRCDPDLSTADFTFKEFAIHNVVDCKQLKLMIEDGQMPSSNPMLNELGFEWEVDWTTELSKTQFANAFGDTVIPKQRDFIYIPMMKRMWEVNAAYDEKSEGLMWRSTTWKLALIKYTDSSSVNNNDFQSAIDNFIIKTYENTFAEQEANEQERLSGYSQVQVPMFAADNLFDIFMEDSTRKSYTRDDVSILNKIYCNKHTIVARNIYKFKNENGCIVYQKGICGESGTISMILETQGYLEGATSREVATFGPIRFEVAYDEEEKHFLMGVEDLYTELAPFTSYMVIYRWNRATVTKELSVYRHVHRTDVPVYCLKPEQYWFAFDEPVCELVGQYNNDYTLSGVEQCQIHPFPLLATNIKLFNDYMSIEDAISESLKYTTTDERCVINDLARPISSGRGYQVK